VTVSLHVHLIAGPVPDRWFTPCDDPGCLSHITLHCAGCGTSWRNHGIVRHHFVQ